MARKTKDDTGKRAPGAGSEVVETTEPEAVEEEAELEDLPDEDLLDDDLATEEDLPDDDDLAEDVIDGPDLLAEAELEVVLDVAAVPAPAAEAPAGEVEDDEEEELDDDDVEASLDVILKERLVVADDEEADEEEEEVADADDRSEGSLRVLPKQPGEFVCRTCFLVKSETQLADRKRLLCRDCV